MAKREPVCARRGCKNPLPRAALLHNDKFCSSICFRVAHGYMTAAEAAGSRRMSESSAEAADKGSWRKQGEATFERAYARKGRA